MDIGSLLEGISQEDMEKLKNTAKQFLGTQETSQPLTEKSSSGVFDPKILQTAADFSALLKERDEKCEFLLALKPLLSEERKAKADEAAMMLKFLHIVNRLKEGGLS